MSVISVVMAVADGAVDVLGLVDRDRYGVWLGHRVRHLLYHFHWVWFLHLNWYMLLDWYLYLLLHCDGDGHFDRDWMRDLHKNDGIFSTMVKKDSMYINMHVLRIRFRYSASGS